MISLLSIIPIRQEASECSEMVSQLLFGEEVEVLETQGNWSKIRIQHDDYEGWVDSKMLSNATIGEEVALVVSHTAILEENGQIFPVTMGTILPYSNNELFTIGEKVFKLHDGIITKEALSLEEAIDIIKSMIRTPYLWGGRTPWGIDCSGFSQLFYRLQGVDLPRDASQQAKCGDDIFLQEAQAGDLAFFEKEGRVTHVGILLDSKTIIHASGWVRIDAIDVNGIFVKDTQSYSHKLISVKRM